MFTAQGDMRQALNNLQSTFDGFGFVNADNVFKVGVSMATAFSPGYIGPYNSYNVYWNACHKLQLSTKCSLLIRFVMSHTPC